MKFQRSTVILVGVALLLGAGVLMAESQRARSPETAEVDQNQGAIFGFAETDVVTLTVERGGETLVFAREGESDWQMTQPEASLAEPGAIAYLLSRLNTDAPLQTVTMAPDQVEDFGFSDPVGTVTVTLQDGTQHMLILGGPDFSGSANYAVVDPPTWPPETEGDAYNVLVVTRDIANGINRPLEEWKMPVEDLSQDETPSHDSAGAAASDSAVPAAPASSSAAPQTTPTPTSGPENPSTAAEPVPGSQSGSENPSEETN